MSVKTTKDIESIKSDLLTQLSVGSGLKQAADQTNRIKVDEALLQLEPHNPTESPAASPLLNGVWELLYTGGYGAGIFDSPTREIALLIYTGGYKPGLLANMISKLPSQISPFLEVDNLVLTIKRDQPRVEASAVLRFFSNEQQIRLRSELVDASAVRLEETYTRAEAFGQTIDLPGPLAYRRSIFVTYLDEDILVVRDETGVPDVWLRKEKDFWPPESEKIEAPPAPSAAGPASNPSVDPSKPTEPGWALEAPEDVGPSDY
jgi:hypothetical protein